MASTSSFRASSSSSTPSIPRTTTYDVFLSFRGEDTRYNFTDHLYSALGRRGIRTFRDDRLRRGEAIAPELLKAIEESRSSVIVFSENYAHSRWCLDELVKIMECQKDLGHAVFPIFYHVDPSHVRKQEGSFGEAFAGYEENWKDKIPRWRTALTEAANLSGWHLLDDRYESNQIKEITNSIFRQLKCKRLDVGANLVGIDSHVKEMILRLHLESSDVRMVGIYGVGGIGKTTIAKVIYNELSCEFEYMSFLENIREGSNPQVLFHLQNQLLGDILEGEGSQNISSVAHRASMIKDILLSRRVFIVLDDVDDLSQLEYLLGHREWLGEGSRVIITTRNKHVLAVQEVDDLYEVEGLNFEEACELFSLYAFKQNLPKSDYRNLTCRVVGYCQGLPLALKVLGSLLCKKTIPQWEGELKKLDSEPKADIHKVLKRSYDGLDRIDKNIFLDLACFFKGEGRDFVLRILDGCDFPAETGISNLNDLCLITLPYNQICMHDLIQQMGWEIVRENFPVEPNKWSRLWDPCDFERALTADEGIKSVETMSLDLSKLKRVCSNSNVFAKMTKLRLLKVYSSSDIDSAHGDSDEDIEEVYDVVMKDASKMQLGQSFKFPSYELRYLRWDGYPLDSLPLNFDGGKLVELHLKCSNIKQLWQGHKDLERLKVIDLSYSRKLSQMSEFSSMPNLERLCLSGCVSLIDIHPSVGNMKKLTTLSLRSCNKLKNLPDSIGDLESLESLYLSNCSKFEKFPEKGGNMKSLTELDLKNTAIKDLPDSIGDLESLESLYLSNCSKFEKFPEKGGNMKSLTELDLKNTAIKDLPDSIGDLESLEILNLSDCAKFEKFPEKGGNMKSLKELDLQNTAIKDLPDSIGDLKSLKYLSLSDCSKFEKFPEKGGNMKRLLQLILSNTAIKDLPDSIGDLESLKYLYLSDCSKFEKFPEKGGNMKSLTELDLKNTAIKDLPDSIGDLESLEILNLSDCAKFEKFPEKGGNMKSLKELDLQNTAIKDLPDSIGDLESLKYLYLSDCSKFEKFPEKGGNMKSLLQLILSNTAIKDLPDSIGDLESLEYLHLSVCSKFEKFPEKGGNMKSLRELGLRNTAIKDLPDSIGDLESLEMLSLSNCPKFEVLPLSLKAIDAHLCTSKEDLSRLLWLCHRNWLKSTTEEFDRWQLSAFIPESSGIPEWITYQNLGSEVTEKLPINWCEDPDFPGFVLSCVYRPSCDYSSAYIFCHDFKCELNLHGNGFRFRDVCYHECWCDCHVNFKDSRDLVCVYWYPKTAIPEEDHHKYTHINASFKSDEVKIKKCGINVIFLGDQRNHMPMLEHPQNSGDNGSALQDANGNVHGANQDDEHYHIPLLDLLRNLSLGDNGSVVLEDTLGNRKRRRNDSLPDVVEEPLYKRLGGPHTEISL
uniref:Disease resistance protein RPV1 n=1 Tax=Vitis rotundifolia TaxID=103349 RepID=RPV1_VITRO|nr:RecName: Full=Disease resistance protein RPV1; AltName: Full=NAD(+) hydrolase RPV1; AltName: Full=Resistance to Plasmopara viticola protein; Short=MrRVP1 [Vitis rotundifolia]AGC24028.1 TIR-NB-LRR type resistance protein RPV1 [Vitis rotundifolia]